MSAEDFATLAEAAAAVDEYPDSDEAASEAGCGGVRTDAPPAVAPGCGSG